MMPPASTDDLRQRQMLYDDIYNADVVMARVGHLPRSMRQDVERIVRILRESFPASGIIHPTPRITSIMLVGRHARRCWRAGGDPEDLALEFWIIVNDRLLTHRRLWQSTEAQIHEAIDRRCNVCLSFDSAVGLKIGKRSGDEYVCDRLSTAITLYHAKRDDPRTRRGTGRKIWTEARTRFDAADAAFRPACFAFREAERAYFALRGERGSDLTDEEDAALHVQSGLDIATAKERRLGAELHEAAMTLLHTPAPNLAALIRKLELVRDEGDGDDHAIVSILADARSIAAHVAAFGSLS